MRYSIMYRERVNPSELADWPVPWDLFVSSFNGTDRVQGVYNTIPANRRVWALHSEYGYEEQELPCDQEIVVPKHTRESGFARALLQSLGDIEQLRICIDITGFMHNTLLALLRELILRCESTFWLVYSDPQHYVKNELTNFSTEISEVRQVDGFQGSHDPSYTGRDHLVLGTGYDNSAMRAVVEHKRHASRTDLLGLPSLQPSMYQENVLSVSKLGGAPVESARVGRIFAAANDPFGTAEALHRWVVERDALGAGNLYLAPTGTKAQVLGFGLFYLAECADSTASIVVPLPARYERETSEGHARSWIYEIDVRFVRNRREHVRSVGSSV